MPLLNLAELTQQFRQLVVLNSETSKVSASCERPDLIKLYRVNIGEGKPNGKPTTITATCIGEENKVPYAESNWRGLPEQCRVCIFQNKRGERVSFVDNGTLEYWGSKLVVCGREY
jgi:hypothetical protein